MACIIEACSQDEFTVCSFEQLNEEPFTVSDDVFRVVLNDDMNKATPENLNLFNFFLLITTSFPLEFMNFF